MIKTLNIKMQLNHANYLWRISSIFFLTHNKLKLLLLLSQSTFIAGSRILGKFDEKAVSRKIPLPSLTFLMLSIFHFCKEMFVLYYFAMIFYDFSFSIHSCLTKVSLAVAQLNIKGEVFSFHLKGHQRHCWCSFQDRICVITLPMGFV